MKIYSMTATFGKLEHETLTLQPGLNVFCAPNEWGKSTWCAFLLAMLYGMDTRAKSTRAALAEKERYAPWSGSPMEGRIDLNWQGRDITIERSTRGRIPLGEFRAYETDTGLDVPELTGENCGQQLLGVEQSVFRRAGFVRLADLPVTQDEALRHRLNALVTTGDESGDAVRLAQSLRDLKNKCRYNRSGLLPQAVHQQEELEEKLREWESLDAQIRKLRDRQEENLQFRKQLENHRKALEYQAAQTDAQRVKEAGAARDQAAARQRRAEAACAELPRREVVEDNHRVLRALNQQFSAIQKQLRELPPEPTQPEVAEAFRGLTPDEAFSQAARDVAAYESAQSKSWMFLLVLSVVCMVTAGILAWQEAWILGGLDILLGILGFAIAMVRKSGNSRRMDALEEKYDTENADKWHSMASAYGSRIHAYERQLSKYRAERSNLEGKLEGVDKQRRMICGDGSPEELQEQWQDAMGKWDELYDARRDAAAAEKHLETLIAMAKHGTAPAFPDGLTYPAEETERLLNEVRARNQQMQSRREQYRARMDTLGGGEDLRRQLGQAKARVQQLEDTYAALTIAQETLADASAELQRRFAPRISKRAQELLSGMTGGRYDRLVISEDFSLRAGTLQEDTLHDALWRSDGTVDQLYLALRLAVSEALTPEAPLILDDALVRFDDQRMEAAVRILQELAQGKQILLFTCQTREQRAAEEH